MNQKVGDMGIGTFVVYYAIIHFIVTAVFKLLENIL